MKCISESGEHKFYIDSMDEENNYYKCRYCDSEFRIMRFFIDGRYNGTSKDI